jgi:hypothetical protein
VLARALLLTTVLFGAFPFHADAQGDDTDTEPDLVNYAFAVQLGTGKYSAADQSVHVYRVPVSYALRSLDTRSWGLTLTLTGAVGFFDFHPPDVLKTGPPDLETLSLVPGVKLDFRLRPNWRISPFTSLGGGKDFSGGPFTYIYSVGLGNLLTFAAKELQLRAGNTTLYSGYHAAATDVTDEFIELRTGGDVVNPLRFDLGPHEMSVGAFTINYLYLNDLEFRRAQGPALRVNVQQEIGVTLGVAEPLRLWFLRISRVGAGVRFGDHLRALRLVFGDPF